MICLPPVVIVFCAIWLILAGLIKPVGASLTAWPTTWAMTQASPIDPRLAASRCGETSRSDYRRYFATLRINTANFVTRHPDETTAIRAPERKRRFIYHQRRALLPRSHRENPHGNYSAQGLPSKHIWPGMLTAHEFAEDYKSYVDENGKALM